MTKTQKVLNLANLKSTFIKDSSNNIKVNIYNKIYVCTIKLKNNTYILNNDIIILNNILYTNKVQNIIDYVWRFFLNISLKLYGNTWNTSEII